MKTISRILLSVLLISAAAACTDAKLEQRLSGIWVTHMDATQTTGNTLDGTITLTLDFPALTDTLRVYVPGGKGMLDTYAFAGTWSAIDNQLTLNLSNKLLQPHSDDVNAKIDSITAAHPEFANADPATLPEPSRSAYQTLANYKTEQQLLENLRKNVGCRSTMTIAELNDSVLVIGDNLSSLRFTRQ